MNSFNSAEQLMPDVQRTQDQRKIAIARVGIRQVKHPLSLQNQDQKVINTIADWTLTVALPATEKGTHMSRFMALLDKNSEQNFTAQGFAAMSEEMLDLLEAEKGDITASFPYFVKKTAPVSGLKSLMDYQLTWVARANKGQATEFELTVVVPVMSLCPCSKAISEYGAHNQRSHITVQLVADVNHIPELEGLIKTIEAQASCELWSMLKRSDEKFVTEHSYDNPKFVEDLIRDVAGQVAAIPNMKRYRIEAENFESIHNHSAYAVIEG